MITDPATSPSKTGSQIGFAIAVAAFYALFMELHIVFGMFYALTIVTATRGAWMSLTRLYQRSASRQLSADPIAGMTPAE